MLAVIKIRGSIDMIPDTRKTFDMLSLSVVNHCVLVEKRPNISGMLKKAKDYITWGEISPEMLEKLIAKRGRLPGDKRVDEKKAKEIVKLIEKDRKVKEIKPVFRLSPPRKGYKAIRRTFPRGDLGYRGGEINKLLERMI